MPAGVLELPTLKFVPDMWLLTFMAALPGPPVLTMPAPATGPEPWRMEL